MSKENKKRAKKSLRRSVSQLAKTHCPTVKINDSKGLIVRQDEKKIPACERSHARDFKVINQLHLSSFGFNLELYAVLKQNFKALIVKFHNQDYLEQISQNYNEEDYSLFVSLIKFYRCKRTTKKSGVLITTDKDFMSAYRIMKLRAKRNIAPSIRPHWKENVLEVIETHFESIRFNEEMICKYLHLSIIQVKCTLAVLFAENKLKRTRAKYVLIS